MTWLPRPWPQPKILISSPNPRPDVMTAYVTHSDQSISVVQCLICNILIYCFCQLYNFGETVSIVFWTDTWQPDSFYDKIVHNLARGLHTLCLLGSNIVLSILVIVFFCIMRQLQTVGDSHSYVMI